MSAILFHLPSDFSYFFFLLLDGSGQERHIHCIRDTKIPIVLVDDGQVKIHFFEYLFYILCNKSDRPDAVILKNKGNGA